jgi:cobalt-zinc-cadmium efflux system membrane fusion protein
MFTTWSRWSFFTLLAGVGLSLGGCGGTGAKGPEGTKPAAPSGDGCAVAGWCTEHGVPEEICALCNPKIAAECQQKGDWCKEHSRPESQCFLCNPKLEAKFAAEYEAKHGKKPPKRG